MSAGYQPRVVRFSLDLEVGQRNFLKMFSAKNEISASITLRALIWMLENDVALSNRVLDLIFISPEVDVEEIEDDTNDEEIADTLEEQKTE